MTELVRTKTDFFCCMQFTARGTSGRNGKHAMSPVGLDGKSEHALKSQKCSKEILAWEILLMGGSVIQEPAQVT